MRNNNREYHAIKFFRGEKRNNVELERLSENNMDFEYRRLLIAENELDLHVCFSKMTVYGWLSWFFLAIAFSFILQPITGLILMALSFLSKVLSIYYKKRFESTIWNHNFALSIVEAVIFNDYGIRL